MDDQKLGRPDRHEPKARDAGASDVATPQETPFDTALQQALQREDLPKARTILADAEAVLLAHEHGTPNDARGSAMSRSSLAGAKARVAMAAGDNVAARAILVQAIERWPDAQPLRAMMTEVMLASGRAKDVRPVLKHLGRSAAQPPAAHPRGGEKKDSTG